MCHVEAGVIRVLINANRAEDSSLILIKTLVTTILLIQMEEVMLAITY